MKKKLIWIIFLFFVLCINLPSDANQLNFSEEKDISDLFQIETLIGGKTIGRGEVQRVFFRISPSDCQRYKTDKNFDYLHVDGYQTTGNPGYPCLPMKNITLEFNGNVEVSEIKISQGKYHSILNELDIAPIPEPQNLSNSDFASHGIKKDSYAYASDEYFPGKFVSFYKGADGEKTYVFLKIFPIQYIPAHKRAILFSEATIEVRYYEEDKHSFKTPLETEAENVIICPDSLFTPAEILKDFHTTEGTPSEVITIEWIHANYEEASDPEISGYAEEHPDFIQNYNYSLSKKIINYLLDDDAHPNLTSITLLGDADLIPPSYYYYEPMMPLFYEWQKWLPIDYLYTSPDYDLVPNYTIGRIAADDSSEAVYIVNKIIDWYAEASWEWFSNTVLIGSDPFGWPKFCDEMVVSYNINNNYFTGHTLQKCFGTDGNYNHESIMPYLSQGQNGIFWVLGHGGVQSAGPLTIEDIMECPSENHVPIIIAPACNAGAFDTDLITEVEEVFCFGEAILKSEGAGIAFWGCPRPSWGGLNYYVDDGNQVTTKIINTEEMETFFISEYHEGSNKLGEIVNNSFFNYIENNDMDSDYRHLWTLYGKSLLGDPALSIPQQISGINYNLPISTSINPTYINSSGYPVYHLSYTEEITITTETNSPIVTFKLTHGEGGIALETVEDNTPPFEYHFQPEAGINNYILRVITEDGKEGWFHFYTTTGNILTDGDNEDWELAEIEPIAIDSTDFDTPELEVTELYVTNDEEYWYFAFNCIADTTDMAYGMAIDCREGGYTGIEGIDQDAMGNWITFNEENGVDFEIYVEHFYHDHIYTRFFEQQDSLWIEHFSISSYWDVGYDTNQNFVEVKIPSSKLGNPESLKLILFSTGLNDTGEPAQDSAPSDTATYHTAHWGQENANTLSNFAEIPSTSVDNDEPPHFNIPIHFTLHQNYPNPFNPSTTIAYQVPVGTYNYTSLRIYDIMGRLVKTLVDEKQEAGYHTVQWHGRDDNGRQVPSGIYVYRLETTDGYEETRKMILLK